MTRQVLEKPILYGAGFALLFFCALMLQCAPQGLQTPMIPQPGLTLAGSAQDVIVAYGAGDGGSYVKGAQKILAGTKMRKTTFFDQWPPGMMVLEAAIIKFAPQHFVLTLFVVTMAIWSVTMGVAAGLIRRLSQSAIFPFVLFASFAMPIFTTYLFFSGIFLSESISIAFFTLACLLFLIAVRAESLRWAAAAGLVMALATLFRAQIYLVSLVFLALIFTITLAQSVIPATRNRTGTIFWMPMVLVFMVFYGGVIAPYVVWNKGGFLHMDYAYQYPWRPANRVPDFVDVGGGDVLCQADPVTCTKMQAIQPLPTPQQARKAVIHVLKTYPVTVLKLKIPYAIRYFFGSTAWVPAQLATYDFIENGLFAAALVLGLAGSVVYRRESFFVGLLILQIASWAGSLSTCFLFMHFEIRYFYIGKIVSLLSAVIVIAWWLGRRTSKRHPSQADNSATISSVENSHSIKPI